VGTLFLYFTVGYVAEKRNSKLEAGSSPRERASVEGLGRAASSVEGLAVLRLEVGLGLGCQVNELLGFLKSRSDHIVSEGRIWEGPEETNLPEAAVGSRRSPSTTAGRGEGDGDGDGDGDWSGEAPRRRTFWKRR
jgi:hypothetical protein